MTTKNGHTPHPKTAEDVADKLASLLKQQAEKLPESERAVSLDALGRALAKAVVRSRDLGG